MPGVLCWGWDGTQWRKVLTDAAGHLQVDILTAPAIDSHIHGFDGANWQTLLVESAAQKNLRVRLYDGAVGLDLDALGAHTPAGNALLSIAQVAGRLPDASVKAINADVPNDDNHAVNEHALDVCALNYAYDGTDWARLRMESNAAFNLRVRLYDGANGITSGVPSLAAIPAAGARSLDVRSFIYLISNTGSGLPVKMAYAIADNESGYYTPSVALMGFDGSKWDRLRTYGTGILKVGRAEVDSTTVRKVAAGQVVAGAHNLYWIACNPSAGNSVWELTDAVAPGGAVVLDQFYTSREGHIVSLDPPMKFATGIYLETFTNMSSVVCCYV